jgi:1-deoxy-D-xylulose 5-phosphate reductoisomerase
MSIVMTDQIVRQQEEIAELRQQLAAAHENVKIANSQTEKFERKWYLAKDALEDSQQALRNVYEVWAGSEGIPNASRMFDAYLLTIIEQMRDAAKEGMK